MMASQKSINSISNIYARHVRRTLMTVVSLYENMPVMTILSRSTMKLGFPARPQITWSLSVCSDTED